jgi:Zn finger protein HypA/HybF involved in hydrogenase expression
MITFLNKSNFAYFMIQTGILQCVSCKKLIKQVAFGIYHDFGSEYKGVKIPKMNFHVNVYQCESCKNIETRPSPEEQKKMKQEWDKLWYDFKKKKIMGKKKDMVFKCSECRKPLVIREKPFVCPVCSSELVLYMSRPR